jgi:hypothetical protein
METGLTAGSGGLTDSNSNGGSLISQIGVPDGNYSVVTTLTLPQSGGTYVTYLRPSSNALSGPAVAGTAYAIELQNPIRVILSDGLVQKIGGLPSIPKENSLSVDSFGMCFSPSKVSSRFGTLDSPMTETEWKY